MEKPNRLVNNSENKRRDRTTTVDILLIVSFLYIYCIIIRVSFSLFAPTIAAAAVAGRFIANWPLVVSRHHLSHTSSFSRSPLFRLVLSARHDDDDVDDASSMCINARRSFFVQNSIMPGLLSEFNTHSLST